MSAAARRAPAGPRAFEASEILAAVAFAIGVQVATFGMLSVVRLERQANAPAISPVDALPVKVRPVLDLDTPLLKLGGGQKYKMPEQWKLPTPAQIAERRAFVSTKAANKVEAIPPKDVKLADAGTKPPPPDAEVAKQSESPETEPTDAGNAPEGPGSQYGVEGGTETDPLKARAVSQYRARLIGWFASRFRVSGTGLAAEELAKFRASATVNVGGDLTVTSFSFAPSGNAAIDAAAKSVLDGSVGQQLPPPPENYPEAVQGQISVVFVCTPQRCN
ncbi:MAG: energy transducer TonB [Myxococcales bacterium]|nr:energy transducer TonB [Myxococcales bacterium]